MVVLNRVEIEKTQAILPLRGKVLNTEKTRMEEIFKNEEINTLIYTIGAGVGTDFDVKDINYGKSYYYDRC